MLFLMPNQQCQSNEGTKEKKMKKKGMKKMKKKGIKKQMSRPS